MFFGVSCFQKYFQNCWASSGTNQRSRHFKRVLSILSPMFIVSYYWTIFLTSSTPIGLCSLQGPFTFLDYWNTIPTTINQTYPALKNSLSHRIFVSIKNLISEYSRTASELLVHRPFDVSSIIGSLLCYESEQFGVFSNKAMNALCSATSCYFSFRFLNLITAASNPESREFREFISSLTSSTWYESTIELV